MTQTNRKISPLRQRMIDDMRMRNFSPSTQRNYIRSVRDFAAYLQRSPDQATAEELRQYLVHLTDNGISPTSYNACLPALKFFFQTTLDQPEVVRKLRTQPIPTRLPKVLSRDEVRRLLEATTSLKYKAAFSVAYGAGLRISEVVNLKVSDIDSQSDIRGQTTVSAFAATWINMLTLLSATLAPRNPGLYLITQNVSAVVGQSCHSAMAWTSRTLPQPGRRATRSGR